MKKLISIFLTVIAILACCAPATAFAADNKDSEAYFTQDEFNELENSDIENVEPYTTGLIAGKNLNVGKKNATTLQINAYTKGTDEVVKCGFTKVIVQRRASSSSSWSKYKPFKDLYSNSNYYTLTKSVTVEKGYQYRVVATHYAKKSLFSTQKIESTSSYISF